VINNHLWDVEMRIDTAGLESQKSRIGAESEARGKGAHLSVVFIVFSSRPYVREDALDPPGVWGLGFGV
jgi:hypothetical protein